MTKDLLVNVSDFTTFPGARYRNDGDGSAEEFFESFIKNSISDKRNSRLIINLDNTAGYASSFVSELAIRICKEFGKKFAKKNVTIISNEDPIQLSIFKDSIKKYQS